MVGLELNEGTSDHGKCAKNFHIIEKSVARVTSFRDSDLQVSFSLVES